MENLPATFGQILEQFHNTFDPSPILDDSAKHAFYDYDEDDPTFLANSQNHKNGGNSSSSGGGGGGGGAGARADGASSAAASASTARATAAARSSYLSSRPSRSLAPVPGGSGSTVTPRSRFSRLGRDSLRDRREQKDEREEARGGGRHVPPQAPNAAASSSSSSGRHDVVERRTTADDDGEAPSDPPPAVVIDLSSYDPHGPYDSLLERVAMMTVQMERMRDEFEYMRSENAQLLENLALAGEAANLPLDSYDEDDDFDEGDDDEDFDERRALDYRTF